MESALVRIREKDENDEEWKNVAYYNDDQTPNMPEDLSEAD